MGKMKVFFEISEEGSYCFEQFLSPIFLTIFKYIFLLILQRISARKEYYVEALHILIEIIAAYFQYQDTISNTQYYRRESRTHLGLSYRCSVNEVQ